MKRPANVLFVFIIGLQMPSAVPAVGQEKADSSVAESVKHLQKLSKIDRDRLDRNVQVFQELSDEKKEQYRRLHDELVKDQKRGGTLNAMLETYTEWLHTLSPVQREQLRSESDSGRKIALIRQFISEHERQSKEERERLMKEEANSPRGPVAGSAEKTLLNPREQTRWPVIKLTKPDIDLLLRVILEDIPPDKRSPEIESVPFDESWKVVVESAKVKQNFSQWPDEALLKKMVAKLRTPTAMWIIRSADRDQSDRDNMVRLLLTGIFEQTRHQIRNISDEQLRTAIEQLGPAEQEKVKQKMESDESPEKKRNWLIDRYLKKNGPESREKIRECLKNVLEVFTQLEVEPPQPLLNAAQKK